MNKYNKNNKTDYDSRRSSEEILMQSLNRQTSLKVFASIALLMFGFFTIISETADANPTGSFFKSSTRRSRAKSVSFGSIGDVLVSWSANKEAAVNTTGGGYKVYYSQTSGFSIASAKFVDVPYSSGSQTSTSVLIPNLEQGTWYFKVVAYSTLNGGSVSLPSAEITVVVNP